MEEIVKKEVVVVDDGLINAPIAENSEIVETEKEPEDIDVTKLARPSCRHCHGRGVVGYNVAKDKETGEPKNQEVLCSCVVNRVERMERFVEKSEKLLNEKNSNSVLDFSK